MRYLRKVKDDILYIGSSDLRLDLFENLFPLEHGVSYNSYLILDEKTCALDTVDASIKEEYLKNLIVGLNGRKLDYLIVNHLEPDHSSVIFDVIQEFPEVTLVLNIKSADMLRKFMDRELSYQTLIVKEADELCLGEHTLTFVMAPMVHWPEVMVTYDKKEHILFSADAFGTFGALSGNIFDDEIILDHQFYDEARRYYTNIVGKYGQPVQTLLKKANALNIQMICPLHGPIYRKYLSEMIHRYDLWSRYEAEDNDLIIIYGSMYNHTFHACMDLANRLADKGVSNIRLYDVSKTDVSYLISEIFRVKSIILACPNYNGGIYPKMHNLLMDMQALNVSNKNIGVIENGTWAPIIGKKMRDILANLKGIHLLESELKINTILKNNDEDVLKALVSEILSVIEK